MKLTGPLVEAFAGTFLSPMYDTASPTPEFHREGWGLYCSEATLAAIAAPREHAKSTAFTHDYGLAVALFREENFIVIVSATEKLAMEHLGEIAKELRENEDLIKEFGIKGLDTDAKGDIICRMEDGYQFRFSARGSGQKMRGLKWNGKRPGLILCDDLEEDEQVENFERRKGFRKWVNRALIPCLRRGGKVRLHGTILHEDSFLARCVKKRKGKTSVWRSLFFRAHKSFDDFSEILWPERFSEAALREIRQRFLDDNDAPGYSQEYLNDPHDNEDAYLRKDDFVPMSEDDYDLPKMFGVGVDFAISKADSANRTSFTVGGRDTRNLTHIVDQRVGRMDAEEIIDEFFAVQEAWDPVFFWVEGGQIWLSIKTALNTAMLDRDRFLNIQVLTPIKDKAARGRTFQKRHKGRATRYDKQAEWYDPYEAELMRFTGTSDAAQDDQFDSTATLFLGFEAMAKVEEDDFADEDEVYLNTNDPRKKAGRNATTGY